MNEKNKFPLSVEKENFFGGDFIFRIIIRSFTICSFTI